MMLHFHGTSCINPIGSYWFFPKNVLPKTAPTLTPVRVPKTYPGRWGKMLVLEVKGIGTRCSTLDQFSH